jgi:hypothetical protein
VLRYYNEGRYYNVVYIQVINNSISNAPHCGILGGGNDYLFESNTLEKLAYEVDDSGAFYTGRQWQQRGNVVPPPFNKYRDPVSRTGLHHTNRKFSDRDS